MNDDRISPPDHSRPPPPPRDDPDRLSLEDLSYHNHLHHNIHHHNIHPNHNPTNNPQMRITADNLSEHQHHHHRMADSSRLARLSPDRTSIFEDRLSPERELPPRLSSSRHVSPAHDSASPQRSPSHTPAPTTLSSTPPPTIPPSSFASTSTRATSTRATSTAGTSEASFEVLSGYDPISPAERHRQWQREQRREMYSNAAAAAAAATAVPAFRPNADLPFPITPQLLRYYPYPGQQQQQQQQQHPPKEEFADRRYSEPRYQEPPMSPQPIRGGQGMMYDGRFSHGQQQQQRNSSAPSGLGVPHYRSSSSEVSVGGSSCSGIPSFAREFEGRGWRFDPILTESSHHSPPAPPSSSASTPRKEESIASVYVNEFASQLDLLLRYAKRPFVALMIVGFFGLLLSTAVQNFSAATPETWGSTEAGPPGPWNSSFSAGATRASYADFPTLMNIESSFEKIVDSAAGGSALARVMKQSEMAVSDLSTVVRYSELKCKETLAERLDVFARDAKGNVRALQGFGSKVGGVLDQLLSINQYALRELTTIQRESAHRPFLARLLTPTSFFRSTSHPREPTDPRTRARVAETFNKAAEVLESNLRLLVADGETIFASLTQLTEQHKPIYDEIVREVVDIKKEEAVVLASLWTKVGGNAAQRKNFRENAELLALIGSYEEQARGYVESTVLELDRMTADLENLRRRVAEPLLVPETGGRGREEAAGIPLSVHVESIETAVDRLVRKRRQRREKEGSWMKRLHEGERKEDIVVEGTV